MRISIIGHSGSGKTVLARRISERLGIPHLHIDRLWFEANGHKVKEFQIEERERVKKYVREKVEPLVRQEAWVSDGWYAYIQPLIGERADQILFLDISLGRRLRNHFTRIFSRKERHPEITFFDDLKFTYQVIKRTYARDPKLRQFVREHADKTKIFHTYAEVERYLENLK